MSPRGGYVPDLIVGQAQKNPRGAGPCSPHAVRFPVRDELGRLRGYVEKHAPHGQAVRWYPLGEDGITWEGFDRTPERFATKREAVEFLVRIFTLTAEQLARDDF